MNQEDDDGIRPGLAIKRAQSALNTAMEARLRTLGFGVSQYACLAQIELHPGITNADLARAVFVSRQATHQLLGGLTSAGLVQIEGAGRAQGLTLTALGRERLAAAETLVLGVEQQMVLGLTPDEVETFRDRLVGCAIALEALDR